MTLEDYRTIFTAVGFVLMLAAASPVLDLVIPLSESREHFSELWLLGPNHTAEDYPFNTAIGEERQIFVGIGNHESHSAYYVVYVKLRNQTQAAPNSTTSTPSPLAPLYEFRTAVGDDDIWEVPVTFSFIEALSMGDSFTVKKISINNEVFVVDSSSMWDSENSGFFYQLFFELWMYDASSGFKYHNRFVGTWLNMTG